MIPSVMRLNETLQQCETFENQLRSVYQTTSELMEAIFFERSETLPLSALDACVDALVHCLNRDESDVMPIILRDTSPVCSESDGVRRQVTRERWCRGEGRVHCQERHQLRDGSAPPHDVACSSPYAFPHGNTGARRRQTG